MQPTLKSRIVMYIYLKHSLLQPCYELQFHEGYNVHIFEEELL